MQPSEEHAIVFRVGEHFVAKILAGDMYEDVGACLWELVRNGLCACMGETGWSPEKTHVAVALVANHPLANGTVALEVMDAGSGFTEANLRRFSTIGPDDTGATGRHGGAAQKQIGRFATYGLSTRVRSGEIMQDGFFILTRTASTGRVSKYFIPAAVQTGKPLLPEFILEHSPELGAYRHHVGPFAIILVPHAVFKSEAEIREALRWRLPRKADRAVKVYVGGKLLHAPPLEDKVITCEGEDGVEAYLQHAREGEEGGIWLCDRQTALRCAYAPSLGLKLPYPLGRPDLIGDIFVSNLLGSQMTNRAGLSAEYLKSAAWQTAHRTLSFRVAPFAQSLLGDEDVFSDREEQTRMVRGIADLFGKCWGPSTLRGPGVFGGGGGGGDKGRPPRSPKKDSGPPGPPPNRGIAVRIGDEEYYLVRYPSLDPVIYAEVTVDGKSIGLNPKYSIQPPKATREEHFLDRILAAVGVHKHPHDAKGALHLAAELRKQVEAARRKR